MEANRTKLDQYRVVTRAESAEYDGIMLTVDSQIPTWRAQDLENTYSRREDAPKSVFESDPVAERSAAKSEYSLRDTSSKSRRFSGPITQLGGSGRIVRVDRSTYRVEGNHDGGGRPIEQQNEVSTGSSSRRTEEDRSIAALALSISCWISSAPSERR